MVKLMDQLQQPTTFPFLRYLFGIWYLWYIVEATNGSYFVVVCALWFGIAFGIIDVLTAKK